MKNTILLLLALICNQLFAQNFIPYSLKNAEALWPVQARESIKNYQLHFTSDNPDIQSREADLILDSTITFHEQDLGGVIFATPLWRTDHKYPLFDVEQIFESVYDNQSWMPQYQTRIRRDEQGRLLTLFSEIYDPSLQTWIPESRLAAFPHGNSDIYLDSMYVDGWSEETYGWQRLLTVRNKFNQQDQMIESISMLHLHEVITLKDLYSYNSIGHNDLIESFLVDGEEDIPAGRQIMGYFNGLLITRTTSSADGQGGFVLESRENFIYTPFSQPDTIRNFTWDPENNGWKIQQMEQFTYDDEERQIELQTDIYHEELQDERYLLQYTYKEEDYLETEALFIYDYESDIFIQDNKKYYYYQGVVSVPTIPLVEQKLKLWPNPSRDFIQMELETPALIQVFSNTGQLVKSQNWTSDHDRLNIVALPSGLYHVKVSTGKGLLSGSFIVQ